MKINVLLNIYVLKLISNKYYIGKTYNDVAIRFNQHQKGFGSSWTKLYKPINMIEFFQTTDKFKEDSYTKKYMEIYGIENVRGGSYTKINLDDYQLKALEVELRTANDLCFICGKHGHFASKCTCE
jgi:predicted GIY-YIG superfamily endonuclease